MSKISLCTKYLAKDICTHLVRQGTKSRRKNPSVLLRKRFRKKAQCGYGMCEDGTRLPHRWQRSERALNGVESDGHQQGTLPCVLCFQGGRHREARGAGVPARTSFPREWHRLAAIQLVPHEGIQDRFVEQDGAFPMQIMEDIVEAIQLVLH